MKKIIFATKNKGKLKEVRDIFDIGDYEIVSLLDFENVPEIVEDRETFEENAIIKAKVVYDHFRIPVIADDSGIAVEQLDWKPGVHSARYAGPEATDEENNVKLLKELEKFPEPHKAKFICAAVYYNGVNTIQTSGEVNGRVIKQGKGENGFGYDPLFIPDGFNVTSGELELKEKNKISHRSRAFRKLKILIENITETQ